MIWDSKGNCIPCWNKYNYLHHKDKPHYAGKGKQ